MHQFLGGEWQPLKIQAKLQMHLEQEVSTDKQVMNF